MTDDQMTVWKKLKSVYSRPPRVIHTGSLWVDNNNGQIYAYNGKNWELLAPRRNM
jgi:hypothetical protein